jgi:hypothetical protein
MVTFVGAPKAAQWERLGYTESFWVLAMVLGQKRLVRVPTLEESSRKDAVCGLSQPGCWCGCVSDNCPNDEDR